MPEDYLPCSDKDVDLMYEELLGFIQSVRAPYLRQLLETSTVNMLYDIACGSFWRAFLFRRRVSRKISNFTRQPRAYTTDLWADCWSIPWESRKTVTTLPRLIPCWIGIC